MPDLVHDPDAKVHDDAEETRAPAIRLPTHVGAGRDQFPLSETINSCLTSPGQITARLLLHGVLNHLALIAAIDEAVSLHEPLRHLSTAEPLVHGPPDSIRDESNAENKTDTEPYRQFTKQFGGSAEPALRISILRLADFKHLLIAVVSEKIADDSSVAVLLKEIASTYAHHIGESPEPVPIHPVPYFNYAKWLSDPTQVARMRTDVEYWRQHLAGAPVLELPTDRRRHQAPGPSPLSAIPIVLGDGIRRGLRDLAVEKQCNVDVLLCAAWAILVCRLSSQAEAVIGMPALNRPDSLDNIIANFGNLVALRINTSGTQTTSQYLEHVQHVMRGALLHRTAPLSVLIDALAIDSNSGANPLFQALFTFKEHNSTTISFPGLVTSCQITTMPSLPVDLALSLVEFPDELVGQIFYLHDLFDSSTIERWVTHLEVIVRAIIDSKEDAQIGNLRLIPEAEVLQVTQHFNRTERALPNTCLIHEIFEKQVTVSPQKTALLTESDDISYATLSASSNSLARKLLENGMAVGELVPLIFGRSIEMVVAQLAVLKCGGAYVPIDPTLPWDRQLHIIADCCARRVLCDRVPDLFNQAGPVTWTHYRFSHDVSGPLPEAVATASLPACTAAYVMYTSGSTGQPKGVIVTHSGVIRLVINCDYLQISADDVVVHGSNPAFDASTFEVWGALLNGASLTIFSHSVITDASLLEQALLSNGATALFLTTALFNHIATSRPKTFNSLRNLWFGGEAADVNAVNAVLRTSRVTRLLNLYGPTETTSIATSYPAMLLDNEARTVPIGRPISNTNVYILDAHFRPVPIGAVGEMYIGGIGVATGYLNRPDLTADRFLPEIFQFTDSARRMYKTGDLARWRVDGNIEYVGRNDDQMKIRGFRIEPGEIEGHLIGSTGVKEAVVLLRRDGPLQKRLIAYLVPDISAHLNIAQVKLHLKSLLPDYMIPNDFVVIDRLPLTANGKVDKLALPPPAPCIDLKEDHLEPDTDTERILAALWQSLLCIARVGRHDDFFELGGNSIVGMKLASAIAEAFHVSLPANVLYERPTLISLAQYVDELILTAVAGSDINLPGLSEGSI